MTQYKTCKTCWHWTKPGKSDTHREKDMCKPLDPDTHMPMDRGFEVRLCKMPRQTFCEAPTEANGFGLTDGSTYMATMATAENFGCILHEDMETPQVNHEPEKRIRELALMCAEWHIGDTDECGDIARELHSLLKS